MKKSINKNLDIVFEQTFTKLSNMIPSRKINVKTFVKVASCSQSTFYYYFDDIDDLRDHIIENLFKKIGKLFSEDTSDADIFLLRQGGVSIEMRSFFQNCVKNRDLFIALLNEHNRQVFITRFKDFLSPQLLALYTFDNLPLDVRTQYLLEFETGGIISMLEYHLKYCSQESIEELIHVFNGRRKYRIFATNEVSPKQQNVIQTSIDKMAKKKITEKQKK